MKKLVTTLALIGALCISPAAAPAHSTYSTMDAVLITLMLPVIAVDAAIEKTVDGVVWVWDKTTATWHRVFRGKAPAAPIAPTPKPLDK